MLTRPEFYAADVKAGLVRSPIASTVAALATTRLRGTDVSLTSLDEAGQRPLMPPNVSGWRTNGYWLNAAAMTARATLAGKFSSVVKSTYSTENLMRLPGGIITREEIEVTYLNRQAETVEQLRAQFALFRVAGANQHEARCCATAAQQACSFHKLANALAP